MRDRLLMLSLSCFLGTALLNARSGTDWTQEQSPSQSANATSSTCTYSLSANSAAVGQAASTGVVQVFGPAGCSYTATAPAGSFASITSGAVGSAPGTVTYSIQPNASGSRSTTLTIAGLPFTINQLGGCLFGLSPTSMAFPASGGTGTFSLGASNSNCAFTAASNNTNFLIVGPTSGSGFGSATINYQVFPNSAAVSRIGTITAGGQTFAVVQAGTACSFALTQSIQKFPAAGGTGTASVNAPAGCAWSATSNSPFVNITAGASGSGNGTVTYNVQPNSGSAQRTGTLTIAGLPYAVTEAGATAPSCTASAPTTVPDALEGRTELVGDMLLTCTGLTNPIAADITLTLNTNITNGLASGLTDAVLSVNGTTGTGGVSLGYNTLSFSGVTLVPVSGGTATVRITNVRVDASLVGATSSLQAAPITGTVTIGSAVPVPVANPTQILGYAAQTMIFQKGAAQSMSVGSGVCGAPGNPGSFTSSASSGNGALVPVTFQEVNPGAFHTTGATPATRLRLVMSNVPAAIQLCSPVLPNEGNKSQLFTADANGAGGAPVPGGPGSYQPMAVTNGVSTSTWVVTGSDPNNFETFTFPVLMIGGTPDQMAQVQFTASLAPASTVSTPSVTAPIPRFRDFSVPQNAVNLRATSTFTPTGSISAGSLVANAKLTSGPSPRIAGSNATSVNHVMNDNQDTTATGVMVGSKVMGGGNITGCTSTAGSCTVSSDGTEATINVGTLAPMALATITISVSAPPCPTDNCVIVQNLTTISDQPAADLSTSSSSSAFVYSGTGGVVGPPASIAVSSGSGQSTAIGTPFASPLQAVVTDSAGNPVNGATVTFTAPASGASATLSSSTATTNGAGVASVTATANSTPGPYTVTASVNGFSTSFSLTNTQGNPGTNIAQGKSASQSSTLAGTPPASVAVDGNTNGNFFNNSVTATNNDVNAWWQVDLGSTSTVSSVVVWNRTDCCGDRLSDFWVFVSNTAFNPGDGPNTLVGRANTVSMHLTAAPNPSTSITLPAGTQARYVRVQLNGTNILSLAEVQVFGSGGGSTQATARQSSTLGGTPPASAAIDGNTDGNFFDNSVTATNNDVNAWWEEDLGSSATIGSVVIWNRTDCCGSRLADYWVFVSDTPFLDTDTPATLASRTGTFFSHQTSAPNPSTTIAVGGSGRYVRVQLTGQGILSLAEVQVQAGSAATNVSQGKTATQSSTLPGTSGAGAAVDGNTNGNFFNNSVTATNADPYSWWQVDLGASTSVSSVTVWNRTDCCGSRLSDYWLFISDTPFQPTDTVGVLVGRANTFFSHQTSAPNPSVSIPAVAQGRYVRIQLSSPDYLSLAEVQVFGTGGAPAKVASQSSTLGGTPSAGVAIDGNTDGNFYDGSVTATNNDPNAWWQVDLGSAQTINSVTIWNRTDCCGSRLSDFWVFVSNTPFSASDTPASLASRTGTFSSHQFSAPNPSVSIPFSGVQGRYVRVQLSGTNYLSLAEVQIQ